MHKLGQLPAHTKPLSGYLRGRSITKFSEDSSSGGALLELGRSPQAPYNVCIELPDGTDYQAGTSQRKRNYSVPADSPASLAP